MPGLDTDTVKHALDAAQSLGFRVVKLKAGGQKFQAVLSESVHHEQDDHSEEGAGAPIEVQSSSKERTVVAPFVGYFRAGKTPLEPGSKIAQGDRVGEIVALGLSNEVLAPIDGEVVEVSVSEGDGVEFGQVLAVLKAT